MGVLDDAIRQHLELKRAHGADEAELKRKEDEALGPVRREAEPAADEGGEAPPEQTQPEAPAPAPEAPVSEEPVAGPPSEEPVAFTDDEPFADEPATADDTPGVVDSTAVEEEPRPAGDTPTSGFDALPEERPAEDAPSRGAGGEDVLEETPEFLQETPEHDRLWFEQKPPRDFDFDDDDQK